MSSLIFVPENWSLRNLKSIGEFKNGINKDKSDFGFGTPFVNLMDVFGVSKLYKKDFSLVNVSKSEVELYNLRKGDVLFVRSSVKPLGVGLTAVIEEDFADTVYSGFLIRFRSNEELSKEFSRYCFNGIGFRKRLLARSTTSANTNINQQSLSTLPILLPPLREQKRIAEILEAWDDAIATTEKLITAKQKFKNILALQELPCKPPTSSGVLS